MMNNNLNKSNITTGIVLILIGLVFLLAQIGRIHWDNLWPIILIIGGGLFFLGFISNRKNYGLLMPASILTITGLLFLYTNAGRWDMMEVLWPTFVLAPGIGFVLMYLFGPKDNNGLWIPAVILIMLALIFYARFWRLLRYWPVVLIAVGIYILVNAVKQKPNDETKDPVDYTESK